MGVSENLKVALLRLTLHPFALVMTFASQQRAGSTAEGAARGCPSPPCVPIIKVSVALLQLRVHKNNKSGE